MRLLRTCCVCQCRSHSNGHRKRRRRKSHSEESVSGSETGGRRTEVVDQRADIRRTNGGGSKRRQRATYRYEVVYRREEFSHDYLDRPENDVPVFRPEEQPQTAIAADYSLLSNYGRLEDFHPPALHTAVHNWQQQPQQHSSYNEQPVYQNFSGPSVQFFF